MPNSTGLQMAAKNARVQRSEEVNAGMASRRTVKKSILQPANENGPPLRRSPRLGEKAKPSQAVVAAKRNARLRQANQANKKGPDIDIRDYYKKARETKDMIRKATGLVYDRRMSQHKCLWDPNYPECPARFTSVLERCEVLGLVSRCVYINPREATEQELLTKHSVEQVAILKSTSHCDDEEFLEELSSRYDAIYIHPTTYQLSLLAAGSTIELVDSICTGKVQNGMAIVRPPGHHAMKSEYCGYCFFNNVALAANHALTHRGLSRILIIDWDVHHGQATQQMFYNDPRVVYFSLHRYEHGSFWPNLRESDYDYIGDGPGVGYNFNVPLNNVGMADADYLAVFHQVLLPMANEFQPELIIVSAGYDAAIGCPEGEMEVTPACYTHLLNSLLSLAAGKVAVVLEGGYCLQSLSEGAALTLRTLLGDPCPPLPSLRKPCEGICDTILNVIYSHRDYWQCYQFQEKYNINAESNKNHHIVPVHIPTVRFLGTGEKPEKYETRNCYPVQSKEFLDDVARQLNLLITNTKLTFAPHRVCLVYDERMMKHKNIVDTNHPEKPERISAIFSRHEEYGLLGRCHVLKARTVTDEELMLLHTKEHIDFMKDTVNMKLRDLSKKQDEFRSVYLHPASYHAASLAAGSVLQVVDSVLNGESRTGVAIVRPPGHHAEEDEPCGFCMFNNVSLAAKYAIEMHGLKRVLLLDWDVHHGNGSQHMFESDPRVLYVSLHRYDNGSFFPSSSDANYDVVGTGRGEGFNVNIPWNKSGMTAAEYLTAFYQVILPVSYQFNPELVLVSSGFDACIGDPLGGCKVSPEAYGHFTHLLTSLAGGRVILSLEGGYNVTSISHAMTICTKTLLGDPLPPLPAHQAACPSAVTSIKNVIRTHSKYWSALCFQTAFVIPQEKALPKQSPPKAIPGGKPTDLPLKENLNKSRDILLQTKETNVKYDEKPTINLPESSSSDSRCHSLGSGYKENVTSEDVRLNKSDDSLLHTKETAVKGPEKTAVPPESSFSDTRSHSLGLLCKGNDTSEDVYITASESSFGDVTLKKVPDEACDLLQESLSRLSMSDRISTITSSPVTAHPTNMSSDTSPVNSEMWSKASSTPDCVSPMKLSFSDEGYRSDVSDVSSIQRTPVLPVVEEGYQEKVRCAADSNKDSNSHNQQGNSENAEAGPSGSSEGASGVAGATGQQTLVDYLASNIQMLVDGEMFAVVPLPNCPHLNMVQPVPDSGVDTNAPCVECGSALENWICLICYTIHCGRYINEHMVAHGTELSHPLTLSFSDLSVWCYACEAYIDNPILYAAKNAAHRSKFGEDMPWSYGETVGLHPV